MRYDITQKKQIITIKLSENFQSTNGLTLTRIGSFINIFGDITCMTDSTSKLLISSDENIRNYLPKTTLYSNVQQQPNDIINTIELYGSDNATIAMNLVPQSGYEIFSRTTWKVNINYII